jgi:hypothetical protein
MSSGEWSGDDEYECPTYHAVFESESDLREHNRAEHADSEPN